MFAKRHEGPPTRLRADIPDGMHREVSEVARSVGSRAGAVRLLLHLGLNAWYQRTRGAAVDEAS